MRIPKLILIALGLVVLFAMLVFSPRGKKVPLGHGNYARLRAASIGRSCFSEANATISCESKSGRTGEVVLWQDLFDGPALLIPGAETNVLLCLYDFDVGFLLVRIDTSKDFEPLAADDRLSRILFTSAWQIQEGQSEDWKNILDYLHQASPKDFRQHLLPSSFRCRGSNPEGILHSLGYQGIK